MGFKYSDRSEQSIREFPMANGNGKFRVLPLTFVVKRKLKLKPNLAPAEIPILASLISWTTSSSSSHVLGSDGQRGLFDPATTTPITHHCYAHHPPLVLVVCTSPITVMYITPFTIIEATHRHRRKGVQMGARTDGRMHQEELNLNNYWVPLS